MFVVSCDTFISLVNELSRVLTLLCSILSSPSALLFSLASCLFFTHIPLKPRPRSGLLSRISLSSIFFLSQANYLLLFKRLHELFPCCTLIFCIQYESISFYHELIAQCCAYVLYHFCLQILSNLAFLVIKFLQRCVKSVFPLNHHVQAGRYDLFV